MARMAKPGALELRDFQAPGALDAFPHVTYAECMKAAQLVTADGLAWSGLEAIVRALATRPLLGFLNGLYLLPGIRRCADAIYRWVARNRYRLLGRAHCTDGSCAMHFTPDRDAG